jgi:hypothetical protein
VHGAASREPDHVQALRRESIRKGCNGDKCEEMGCPARAYADDCQKGLAVCEDSVWKAAISRQVNSQACVWSFIAQGTKPPPNMQCRYGFRKTA